MEEREMSTQLKFRARAKALSVLTPTDYGAGTPQLSNPRFIMRRTGVNNV